MVLVGLAALVALRRGPRADHTGSGNFLNDGVLRTVVLGDSVARGAGDEKGRGLPGCLDREFRGMRLSVSATQNLGINSGRTVNVEHLLRQAQASEAIQRSDIVVISVGGNDLYGDPRARLLTGLWPWFQRSRTLDRVEDIVQQVRRINPAARIYLLGLYNPYRHTSRGAWIDTQVNLWDAGLIRRFAAWPKVTVVRIADLLVRADRISPIDHFHPGSQGYAAIARRITETF